MPHLALTRAGVARFSDTQPKSESLWIGSDVLSEPEIRSMHAMGINLSVFVYPVRTCSDVEDAVPTLREHHPHEPVWVEALPEEYNPRSADIGQAFLWREFIVGVHYKHNEGVVVASGPHQGEGGSLVSLVTLEPEPEYVMEAMSGQDLRVLQSELARADA